VDRRRDEREPAACGHRAAEIEDARRQRNTERRNVARRTQWPAPDDLACVDVDRRDASPRWLIAGKAKRREERPAVDRVRRAFLRKVREGALVRRRIAGLAAAV